MLRAVSNLLLAGKMKLNKMILGGQKKKFFKGKLCVDAEVVKGIVVTAVDVNSDGSDDSCCSYYVFVANLASSWWSGTQARMWFPRHATVLIQEPTVSLNKDGIPCMELLNPASIQIIGIDEDHEEDDAVVRAQTSLRNQEFIRAAHMFSKCLRHEVDNHHRRYQMLRSRCEAWLGAGFYDKAVTDADAALHLNPKCLEVLESKGKALLGIQQYSRALECFEASKSVALRELSERLVKNSVHGIFELEDYYLSRECRSCTPECGDFVGPVTIEMTRDGKGRGLFATREVRAGEVILYCNPLAAMFDSSEFPSEDDIVAQIVRSCMASSRSLRQLVSLVDSEEIIPETELFKPNVDRDFSESISGDSVDIPTCARKTSVNYGYKFERIVGKERQREFLSGLWVLTAFANHSCAPNATQKAVGSGSLMRAARDLSPGEEVTLAYLDPLVPWEVRRAQMRSKWGFECRCERCRFESSRIKKFRWNRRSVSGMEKEMSSWRGVDAIKHRHWVRASYHKAYQDHLLLRVDQQRADDGNLWGSVMEALHFTAPGYEGLLTSLLLLAHQSGRSANVAQHELILRECVASFGKLSESALESIIKREVQFVHRTTRDGFDPNEGGNCEEHSRTA